VTSPALAKVHHLLRVQDLVTYVEVTTFELIPVSLALFDGEMRLPVSPNEWSGIIGARQGKDLCYSERNKCQRPSLSSASVEQPITSHSCRPP
jgi:hypothetical protein